MLFNVLTRYIIKLKSYSSSILPLFPKHVIIIFLVLTDQAHFLCARTNVMGVCESSFDLADRKSSYEFMRNCSYVIVP